MHGLCAQLHFQGAPVAGVDGRMDALVAIWFWERNVIFYLPRYRPPMGVDDTERGIAIGDRGEDYREVL